MHLTFLLIDIISLKNYSNAVMLLMRNKCNCKNSFCCEDNFVPPMINGENINIMIVGEAPGKSEVEHKVPFCGAAGKKLRQILILANFPKRGTMVTNIVKCRPDNNRTPSVNEIMECSHHISNVIIKYKPQLKITLGKTALIGMSLICNGMPSYKNFLKVCFYEYKCTMDDNNFSSLVLPHPAYFLYRENKEEEKKSEEAIKIALSKVI